MAKENILENSAPLYFDGRRKMFEIRAGQKYYPFYALNLADMARVSNLGALKQIDGKVVNDLLCLATPTIDGEEYLNMINDLGGDGLLNVFTYYLSLQDFETGDVFEEKHGRLH